MNIKIGKGGSGSVNSSKGGSGKTNQRKYIDLLPASNIVPSIDTTDGLVAFWDLDNANSLSTIPASYGNYTLQAGGFGYSSVNGKIKNGFEFADDSQGLWTNQQLWNLLTNPTSFSVSFWHKIPDNTISPFSVMGSAFGSMGFHFDYYNFGHSYDGSSDLNWVPGSYGISFRMSGPGGPYKWNAVYANEATSNNTWTLVTATYDLPTTTMKLYLNGVLKSTYSSAVIGSNSLPNVGGFAINGSVLNGSKEYGSNQSFDALGFWNKTLNQNEISSLYNNGNGKQFFLASNLTFLFDPIFYKSEIQNERHQILVQDCSLDYVNGIYTQTVSPSLINNRPYYFKEDEQIEIYYDGSNWVIYDLFERDYISLFYKATTCGQGSRCRPHMDTDWSNPDGGDAYDNGETPPTITEYLNLTEGWADLDPVYLEELRNYKIDNIIPSFPFLEVRQHIPGTSFNTRKTELKNNVYRYIKYNNNDDVEHLKTHGRVLYSSFGGHVVSYKGKNLQDLINPLLKLRKNDNSTIFNSQTDFTLNMFVKLQRPVAHTAPGDYLVREKRGIFLTSYGDQNRALILGYRSPYYNIDGDTTYKLKFEPFSFVFSFGHGWTSVFGYTNFTLMTDYKYKFGEMYMLSISKSSGEYKIYINGELQTTALLAFNPCIYPTSSTYNRTRRLHGQRIQMTPLAPEFLQKDGSTYPYTSTSWTPENIGTSHNYLCFGKSRRSNAGLGSEAVHHRRKRYLNNLDIGVINAYNIALSQTQISEMYNNFRYRYI